MTYEEQRLSTWAEFVEVADFMTRQQWVFRGHDRAEWPLQTSLEREFAGDRAREAERLTLWQFVRRAPQLLPPHLIPHDFESVLRGRPRSRPSVPRKYFARASSR
jgi:hypothetical protein